jgi:hypothetical protein
MKKPAEPQDGKEPIVGANGHVEKQIEEALRLADFCIESGFKASDGHPIPSEIIATIQGIAAKLGFFKGAGLQTIGGALGSIAASEWVEFVLAYYQLAALVSPVTAQTLIDTEPYEGYTSMSPTFRDQLSRFFLGSSPANKFTKGLWYVTILFAVIVVGADSTVSLQASGKISNNLFIDMAKIFVALRLWRPRVMRVFVAIGTHIHLPANFRCQAQAGILQSHSVGNDCGRHDYSFFGRSSRHRSGSQIELDSPWFSRRLQHGFSLQHNRENHRRCLPKDRR